MATSNPKTSEKLRADPAERLATFLHACGGPVRQSGNETVFRCPCSAQHTNGDAHPSGNVRLGDDGRLLVMCRAGCATLDMLAAIGWQMSDLMPSPSTTPDTPRKRTGGKPKRKEKRVYPDLDSISAAAGAWKKGRVESTRVYRDAHGNPALAVIKVRHDDGSKEVPQARPERGGWVFGGIGNNRPLYDLPELLQASTDTPVLFFEGEQKVDCAKAMGFLATTASQGAGNAKYSDFAPLAGRIVHLFADNDDAGHKHMKDVARRAYAAGAATVTFVTLPILPPKGDIIDYYRARKQAGAADDQIADDVRDAIARGVEAPRKADAASEEESDENGEVEAREASQADLVVALARDAVLFHDDQSESFAAFEVNGHRETWRISSSHFQRWLANLFYRQHRRAVTPQSMTTAIDQLSAMALFDGPCEAVFMRTARSNGAIWLDLCNDSWQAVEITATGWRVADAPTVRFVRRPGMKALPAPQAGLGDLTALFELLHLDDHDVRLLITAWLVNTLIPSTSYPIIAVSGEQGSGKSTFCRALHRLVDPHDIEGRSPPRNEEDIAVAAQHAHLLSYENISVISQSLSDAFCRVATGAGFAARKLFTDADERQLVFCRPVIINGIGELATRSDLADRVVAVQLESIPPERRQTEAALWSAYDKMRPMLLGALLDLVVKVLQTNDLPVALERMAEYSQLGAKIAVALRLPPEAFTASYGRNRDRSSLAALESSAIGPVLLRLVRVAPLKCPMGSLLFELQQRADKHELRNPDWPKTARGLGDELRRISPNLARAGVTVQFLDRRRDGYWIRIEKKVGPDVHDVHDVHGEPQPSDSGGLGA